MRTKSAAVIAAAAVFVMTAAAEVGKPTRAPLNPAFVNFIEQQKAAPAALRNNSSRGLGYVPAPFKLPAAATTARGKITAGVLPTTYDLRNYGKVTSVKNQGAYGTCWSFASLGSLESCLLTAENWDFSENNLANLHGYDWGFDDGGNHFISTAYLARWSGPVLESQDPYPNPGGSPTGLTPQKHVQSVFFLPAANGGSADKSWIKQAVMTYGAVYTVMYIDDPYFNAANGAYYYNGTSYCNHAVLIVGWDDSYSRSNFLTPPAGDGAFLVRNSWGTGWGLEGYFYASYYDSQFACENAVFASSEPATNYSRVYQYDPLGLIAPIGYTGFTTCWGANIFTASAAENLRAVSFYAMVPGTQYEIQIRTGVTAGQPASGTLCASQSGSVTCGGYHTITLNTSVGLIAGQRFSVIVKFTTPDYNYPLPVEMAIPGYSSGASAAPGQSFISADGTNWSDLTEFDSTANACIKAFAGTGSGPVPPPEPAEANDFDGDGKSDFALFYYPAALWHVWSSARQSWLANGVAFGSYGWLPVPGDYDGYGKADAALYSLWYGNWQIYCQETAYGFSANWGGNSLMPVNGDFDADNKADYALFDFYTGQWYIYGSSAGWMANGQQFGGYAWLPFLADYLGEGRNQVVVYDEYSGNWYFYSVGTGRTSSMQWGGPGYIPVPSDFDGDSIADFALYNYATGQWYIFSSVYSVWLAYGWTFGGPGYLPVIGDYNGGGADDIVLYSDIDGYWLYYLMESDASGAIRWGGTGYIPFVSWWLYWYYGV